LAEEREKSALWVVEARHGRPLFLVKQTIHEFNQEAAKGKTRVAGKKEKASLAAGGKKRQSHRKGMPTSKTMDKNSEL